ncbi:hypothetical protein ES708_18152 [subsurface metagenome]
MTSNMYRCDGIKYENIYLPDKLPDEIYYKLCGAWSPLSGPPDSEQEFSWGIGKYHTNLLLIIDFGADPPSLAAGSQGVSCADIQTVEDLGNDLYKLNLYYKDRFGEETFFYIIGFNPDSTIWFEETSGFVFQLTGKEHVLYKTSGPKKPNQ